MTNKTKVSIRAISEAYVRSQLQQIGSQRSVPKKDINMAVEKVSNALAELEKAKEA
jgi:hypothetical protein